MKNTQANEDLEQIDHIFKNQILSKLNQNETDIMGSAMTPKEN